MEKLVNQSKLIYYANMFNEEDIIVEMKLGRIYEVETYAGETGDTVCKFTSELESITIDDDWINKEDYPDGFITELIFKNGVTIYEPQYDHNAVNICESDIEANLEKISISTLKEMLYKLRQQEKEIELELDERQYIESEMNDT